MSTSIKVFLLCIIPLVIQCAPDYYWRDWNGTAPSDAFVAGTDSRGPLYLAQAYVYTHGLFVGHILNGQKSITVNPSRGAGPTANSDILKVLCSKRNALMWVPSDQKTTSILLRSIMPVIGGIVGNNATVYVGKYNTDGYSYIGNVHSDYYEYYTNESGSGKYTKSYEILIQSIHLSSYVSLKPSMSLIPSIRAAIIEV